MAHLASDLLPESFDVVVDGTGLTLSLVAAALGRTGRSVLHLDRYGYYGELWATLLNKDFEEWLSEQITGKIADDVPLCPIPELGGKQVLTISETSRVVSNVVDLIPSSTEAGTAKVAPQETNQSCDQTVQSPAQPSDQTVQSPAQPSDQPVQSPAQPADQSLVQSECEGNKSTAAAADTGEGTKKALSGDVSSPKTWQSIDKRWFSYDLMPKPLYCRGDMINCLTETNIGRYLEFRAIAKLFTRTGDKIERVPCSREDVFNTKAISMVEKRKLMKFLTFCAEFEKHSDEYKAHESIPYSEYLRLKGHTPNIIQYIVHTIAMVDDSTTTIEGLRSTQLFIKSLGRFGNAPFLFPIYGSGELPQSFCRFSAVWGGVYCLKRYVQALVMEENKVLGVVCSSGQKIDCKAVVTSAKNLRATVDFHESLKSKRLSRAILITDGPLESTAGEMTIVTVPALSLGLNQTRPFHLLQLDPHSSCTIPGTYMIHVTVESTQATAYDDLHVVAKTFFNIGGHDDCNKNGPNLLRAIYFNVDTFKVDRSQTFPQGLPRDLHLVSDPDDSISYEAAMKEAKEVFQQLCPGEQFLPSTPSPEDIVYDDTPPAEPPANNGDGGAPSPPADDAASKPPPTQPPAEESIPGTDSASTTQPAKVSSGDSGLRDGTSEGTPAT